MQQSEGLTRAIVHGHARAQKILADFHELDAQMRSQSGMARQITESGGAMPDGHGVK
jgi:hypothetical protein